MVKNRETGAKQQLRFLVFLERRRTLSSIAGIKLRPGKDAGGVGMLKTATNMHHLFTRQVTRAYAAQYSLFLIHDLLFVPFSRDCPSC